MVVLVGGTFDGDNGRGPALAAEEIAVDRPGTVVARGHAFQADPGEPFHVGPVSQQLPSHSGFISHWGLSGRNGRPTPTHQGCVLVIVVHITTLTPTFWACSRNRRTCGPSSYLSAAPRAFIFWYLRPRDGSRKPSRCRTRPGNRAISCRPPATARYRRCVPSPSASRRPSGPVRIAAAREWPRSSPPSRPTRFVWGGLDSFAHRAVFDRRRNTPAPISTPLLP